MATKHYIRIKDTGEIVYPYTITSAILDWNGGGGGGGGTADLSNYVTLEGQPQNILSRKTFTNANGIAISNGTTAASLYVDSQGILHTNLPFVSDSYISSYNSGGGGGGTSGGGIDFSELADIIIGGSNISVTPDTTAQTLTIDYTGSGGGGEGEENVIETVKVNGTALPVADKAVDITVASGSTNGTIKVNGTDVAVKGLKTAAYSASSAFDAAGAASAVLGSPSDTSASKTVYGAFAKIEEVIISAGSGEMNIIDAIAVNGTNVTVTGKTASISIAESQNNGNISVQGVDVPIHGLGTAAYADTSNFMSSAVNYAGSTTVGGTANAAYKLREIVNNTEQDTVKGSGTVPIYFSNGVPVACDLSTTYAPYHAGGYVTLDTPQIITGQKTFNNVNGVGISNGSVTGQLYIDSNGALHVTTPIISDSYISGYGALGNPDSALATRVTQLESTIASLEARIAALENN